jgi:hypothetical protein
MEDHRIDIWIGLARLDYGATVGGGLGVLVGLLVGGALVSFGGASVFVGFLVEVTVEARVGVMEAV